MTFDEFVDKSRRVEMLQRILCIYICCFAGGKYYKWDYPFIALLCFLYGFGILIEGVVEVQKLEKEKKR
jgi:hypothetical protein